ncbi:cytochrome c oxidase copper chaperone 1-like [Ananas comosus]|uniref:Cytochrome c oxidase copper chaperone 1-like n=1 Tax=Ananas comosus TaxID=4615 RepID=A0A6P5F3Q2_ANACO|nr:cytochrome c oxidase copper chaperone 1-like [Ananas comosus]XP_020090580.1 cytochrome c oxidase copper chaperone 1-like [Ananas comosus]
MKVFSLKSASYGNYDDLSPTFTFLISEQMAKMSNVEVGMPLPSKSPQPPAASEALTSPNPPPESKPKKKICCACPDTKKLRDECIVEHGEAACGKWIEAHKQCLRAEGFKV